MNDKQKIIVKSEQAKTRLDVFLSEEMSITRSQVKKMIDRSQVLVNGELPTKAGERVHDKDEVEVKSSLEVKPKEIIEKEQKIFDIEIVEETKDFVVVNKPAGLLVHPTEANEPNTLTSYLVKKYPKIIKVGDSEVRPGIVHRLDKEASGLMVVAKTQKMFEHLKKQFQARTVYKEYGVLVYGNIDKRHDVIDFDIDRGKTGQMVSRPKMDKMKLKNVGKDQPGKGSLTEFWKEKELIRFTLLKVKIHSGRTHQIRVHMYAFNHPVVGDKIYYNKNLVKKSDKALNRLFLHSRKLCFNNLKDEEVCFESNLPEELSSYLEKLK